MNAVTRLERAIVVASASLLAAPGLVAQEADGPHARRQAELLISGDWLAAHLEDPGLVVLHVGTDSTSYLGGHVPGARFLGLSSIVTQTPELPSELPPVEHLVDVFERVGVANDSRVVLYGDLAGLAAARGFFTLDYLGLGDRAALLDGGLEAWKADGRLLSKEPATGRRGLIRPRPQPEIVVDAEWLASRLSAESPILIDARPSEQYQGSEAGTGVDRPGHIPGAVSFFWQDALVSPEHPVLRSREVLQRRYRELGIQTGSEIVTYCRTGVQASHAYFVARYLGYRPRMYDASYIDWSARTDLAVER